MTEVDDEQLDAPLTEPLTEPPKKPQKKPLTPKQERFCHEYLVDFNASQAAIRAGYSGNCASDMGHQNITHPAVAAYIAKLRKRQTAHIDSQWLLNRLKDEAEADVADLYGEDGQLLPVKKWPMVWRKGLVAGLDSDEIRSEGAVLGLAKKLKLSDRLKRLELIGKHIAVGAFLEKHEHTGAGGKDLIPPEAQTPEAIARRLLFLLERGAAAADSATADSTTEST